MTDPGDDVTIAIPRSAVAGLRDLVLIAYQLRWRAARRSGMSQAPPPWLDAILTDLAQVVPDTHPAAGVSRLAPQCFAPPSWSREIDSKAAAELLIVSPQAVRGLARRGALPARRTGNGWILDADAVEDRARRLGRGFGEIPAAEPQPRTSQ